MNKKNKQHPYFAFFVITRKWIATHRLVFFLVAFAVLSLTSIATFLLRTHMPVSMHLHASTPSVSQPLHITLNQKIAFIDTTKIVISPNVLGTWQYEKGALLGNDQLLFIPKTYFTVATNYTVTFPRADRTLFGAAELPAVAFRTESAPGLLSSSKSSFTPDKPLSADFTFSATLTSPNRQLRSLVMRTNPTIPMTMKSQNDTTFTWTPTSLLPQGQKINIELYDEKNNVSLLKKDVTVASEPHLTSPTSRTRLTGKDPITLQFDQPIDTKSQANITFDTPGKSEWKTPTEYVFTPDSLAPGKTYTYAIKKGLRSTSGGVITQDLDGNFSTIGSVTVISSSPKAKNMSQAKQVISFTFDQPVDQASAQARVTLSSGTVSGISWQGNTMNVTAVDLGYQRTVTATIAAGVINAGFGLPSAQAFSTSFTTETRSAKLSVPYYRQQHSATCTAATLRMVLGYRGISADEMGLVNAMGYAPRNKDTSTNPPTWDDPNEMFVGSIDGSITAGTGAGPDAAPIAKAARAYGRDAQNFTGINANWIAGQIYAGNPVIMFGAFRATGTTSWQTPSGRTTTMNLTGHVTVVTGVVGELSNPTGFYVHDPLNGSSQYWTAGTVSANIARDPYGQAVVVY